MTVFLLHEKFSSNLLAMEPWKRNKVGWVKTALLAVLTASGEQFLSCLEGTFGKPTNGGNYRSVLSEGWDPCSCGCPHSTLQARLWVCNQSSWILCGTRVWAGVDLMPTGLSLWGRGRESKHLDIALHCFEQLCWRDHRVLPDPHPTWDPSLPVWRHSGVWATTGVLCLIKPEKTPHFFTDSVFILLLVHIHVYKLLGTYKHIFLQL